MHANSAIEKRKGWLSLQRLVAAFGMTCVWLVLAVTSSAAIAREPTGALVLPVMAKEVVDPPQSFRALCYHDVRDNVRESFRTWPEPTAIDTRDLVEHFSWLAENGYQPVSLQQVIDARAGGAVLPDKAVLLTFDDGYKSFYTKVFPLLKLFNYPAVVALVGEWMDAQPGEQVQYGERLMPRTEFMSWDEVREIAASGLVEIASHSYALHKGIKANPQGNEIPAAVSRPYSGQGYESDDQYAARVRGDLQKNNELLLRELSLKPRVMVWPYGAYNHPVVRFAAEAGMPVAFNLEPGPNAPSDSLQRVRRALITYDTKISDLARLLREPAPQAGTQVRPERVIHVDLDYIYDADPQKQEANLSLLLDRIVRLRPSTVYLQAYADPDGDGVAEELYFPSRHLPMRADLFSRVAWQLSTRAAVRVYAWMPVLAFRLDKQHPASGRLVQVMPGAPAAASDGRYHRLSPFDALARQTVTEIYEDLGKHARFDGVLFHDDATLSDYEDSSTAALQHYREQWQMAEPLETLRSDPARRRLWTEKKAEYLTDFTLELARVLREYQPQLLTARNLYAQPVLEPASEEWYAQRLRDFLAAYDYTAVMAMPFMEGAPNPAKWYAQLLAKVKAQPDGLRKTIFELQSRDWKTGKPIPAKTLVAHSRQLRLSGARHWGYYPDDFHQNQPDEAVIKPAISVETFPVRR
ncbi:poly-beta-1,6-N-acetyl-D-glucosamine N-deacetylase PgaB [Noviherbaspirillum agri]